MNEFSENSRNFSDAELIRWAQQDCGLGWKPPGYGADRTIGRERLRVVRRIFPEQVPETFAGCLTMMIDADPEDTDQ